MKRILLVAFCLLAFPLMASHIVGGEFELLYLGNNEYRLNLIYYFDLNNNTFTNPPQNAIPEFQEPTIQVAIFRKADKVLMRNVTLAFLSRTRVNYTQPECSNGEIITDKLIYTAVITLPDDQYNSPQGYYVIWERCCRNYTITNIISQDPQGAIDSPNAAGQTFFLEFPPVVKNGEPFINSSPKLFPPLNDYACPHKPYYADFAGTDEDGDSLAYSLVTPLSTHTTLAVPVMQPAPFPEVTWRAPFSLNNIVGGMPDLNVSTEGFLTVTPTLQGLYVFAVMCEEFRNGEKIGEVRRDFQMLVVDGCEPAEPPQILGRTLTDTGFPFDEDMNVSFTKDADRCIEVQVSDPDALSALNNFGEDISIRAIPLNFKKDISTILPSITNATLTSTNSNKIFTLCFDQCPPNGTNPFQVGIVAYDDACSLPLSDTLKVTVTVVPPPNEKPKFQTGDVIATLDEGDPKQTWQIDAVDIDGDLMDIFLLSEPGFAFAEAGMEFMVLGQQGNTLNARFSWDPNCTVYDFTQKTEFNIRFLVEDRDHCDIKDPDTLNFKLKINLPVNEPPEIFSDVPATSMTKKVFETLEFNVWGTDTDTFNSLLLNGKGRDFDLVDYNISFPEAAATGNVTSHFSWNIDCAKLNLSQKNEFEFDFIVVDNANRCLIYKADTLTVKVKVEPPSNEKPLLTVVNTNPDLSFLNNQQSLTVGQQISLGLVSNDVDQSPRDNITIEMISAKGNVEPEGYLFTPAEGKGSAETTFTWNTDCTLFKDGVYENNYTFTFLTKDDRCFNAKADTVKVDFTVKDIEVANTEFNPPNIITPNGDQLNEFFAMVRENKETKALESILPPDNCIGRFVNIIIYNRWGKEIFQSANRDFRWYPHNEAAGVYFYTLKYSHKEYKGSITLVN